MPNLLYIQQQMIRYGMSSYFALGVIGNICNCIVFTRNTNRLASSSVYFLSLAIIAIVYLSWTLSPLFAALNYVDLQTTSLFYCKTRIYGSHVLGQCLRYIVVLISIDRFLATRGLVRTRSLNSVLMARKLVFIVCVFISMIAMHLLVLMEIRGKVCGMFGTYKLIYSMYQVTLVGILPPVLMSTFSILTIRRLHRRHGLRTRLKRRDRNLMQIVIAEVLVNVITSMPYSCTLVYTAITTNMEKTTQRIELESFLLFVAQFLGYLISVLPFYVFMFISKPFRNELIGFWKQYILRRTRIMPFNDQNVTATVNGRMTHNRH